MQSPIALRLQESIAHATGAPVNCGACIADLPVARTSTTAAVICLDAVTMTARLCVTR